MTATGKKAWRKKDIENEMMDSVTAYFKSFNSDMVSSTTLESYTFPNQKGFLRKNLATAGFDSWLKMQIFLLFLLTTHVFAVSTYFLKDKNIF